MLNHGDVDLLSMHGRILAELAHQPTISQEKLAQRLHVAMRTLQRHLTGLEAGGWVLVDREKRPFEYGLHWSRTWPEMPWLLLIVLHPACGPAFSGLSDLCLQVYDSALESGADPARALENMMALPAGALPR